MRLTQIALGRINNQRTRLLIALALDCREMTIRRYIAKNDDTLTKSSALQVIKEETNLTDAEILESAEVEKA